MPSSCTLQSICPECYPGCELRVRCVPWEEGQCENERSEGPGQMHDGFLLPPVGSSSIRTVNKNAPSPSHWSPTRLLPGETNPNKQKSLPCFLLFCLPYQLTQDVMRYLGISWN